MATHSVCIRARSSTPAVADHHVQPPCTSDWNFPYDQVGSEKDATRDSNPTAAGRLLCIRCTGQNAVLLGLFLRGPVDGELQDEGFCERVH